MNRRLIAAFAGCLAIGIMFTGSAFGHATGDEARTDAECNVLAGSALGGARGECMRCIARPHYHFHSHLSRRQRCHRENHDPTGASRRHRH